MMLDSELVQFVAEADGPRFCAAGFVPLPLFELAELTVALSETCLGN